MQCLNCSKETKNPKFCNRSCTAVYNNKHFPKRRLFKVCELCTSIVRNYRSKLCEHHYQIDLFTKAESYKNKTLGELRAKSSVKGKHSSWLHVEVRAFCRSWNKNLTITSCIKCGYSKHVEIAHIKPIASFSDDTMLRTVNDPSNLLPLCRNCHWEFDHGLITI